MASKVINSQPSTQAKSGAPTPEAPKVELDQSTVASLCGAVSRLYSHLSHRRRVQLLGLFILMLVGAVAELVTLGAVLPFLAIMTDPAKALEYPVLQELFSVLGWEDPSSILLPATMMFGVVVVSAAAVRMLLIWVSNKITYGIGFDLGVQVYRRTLFQPYRYHVGRNTSQIIAGIGKVQMVIDRLLIPLMTGIIAVITSIAILVALVLIDPVVAIAAGVGFTVLYLLVTLVTRRKLRKNSRIIAQAQDAGIQSVQEGLGGIRDVLLSDTQDVYVTRFKEVDAALRRAQVANTVIGNSPRYLIEAIGMVLIAVLAYWISQRAGGLVAAIPVLGALAIGVQKLLPLMQQIYIGWSSVVGNRGTLDDVVNLVEQPIPSEYLQRGPRQPLPFDKAISLKDLSFRYMPDRTAVLKGLNMEIPRGSRVGLIGRTGSGKSTVLDLIMGLLEPSSGSIFIDGTPLTSANRRSWQAHIAHVPQAIYLSDASIAENIALGVKPASIDYDRMRAAARAARIEKDINGLPDQYGTRVGERGIRLSGGQRQRIGIARALYKQADVLVFDEATSALDGDTESSVMNAIHDLGAELTVIMVAHRLSTLSGCDRIFELRDGELLREASYAQIQAGLY